MAVKDEELIHPEYPAGCALRTLDMLKALLRIYDNLIPELQISAPHYAHGLARMCVANAEHVTKHDDGAPERLYICAAFAPSIAFVLQAQTILRYGHAVLDAPVSEDAVDRLSDAVRTELERKEEADQDDAWCQAGPMPKA